MKKNIILISLFLPFVFVLSNYNIFLGNYFLIKANNKYEIQNYTGALALYGKSLNYLSGSNTFHNSGNSFYKLGEELDNDFLKNALYTTSIDFYEKALNTDKKDNKKEDPDTRFNYEFVKKKLEELNKKDDEEKKEEEEKNDEQEDKENQENNEKQNQEKDKKEEEKTNEGDKNKDKKEEENETEELSEEEQVSLKQELSNDEVKQIETYLNKLKNEEKHNRKFYNTFNQKQSNIFNFHEDEKDW